MDRFAYYDGEWKVEDVHMGDEEPEKEEGIWVDVDERKRPTRTALGEQDWDTRRRARTRVLRRDPKRKCRNDAVWVKKWRRLHLRQVCERWCDAWIGVDPKAVNVTKRGPKL